MMTRNGLIKYSMVGLISIPLLTAVNLSSAAETLVVKETTANAVSAEDYRTAKNMPLPQVSTMGTAVDRTQAGENDGVKKGSAPKWPDADAKPDLNNRLFEGTADHGEPVVADSGIAPMAVGTSGAYYTSSRISRRSSNVSYPWRTVGRLFFKIGTTTYWCSASVIGARIVVTAGHCVHSGNGAASGWYNSWRFIPAYDSGKAPYKEWTAASATVSGEWYSGGGGVPNSDDYALLVMNDQLINNVTRKIAQMTGRLGWLTNNMHPNHLTAIGYPGNLDSGEIMHNVNAETWLAYAPNNYSIGSDMQGGSSGGPWLQNFGTPAVGQPNPGGDKGLKNRVLGVTSWGWVDPNPKEQGAAQFDGTFVNMWNIVCGFAAGNC